MDRLSTALFGLKEGERVEFSISSWSDSLSMIVRAKNSKGIVCTDQTMMANKQLLGDVGFIGRELERSLHEVRKALD